MSAPDNVKNKAENNTVSNAGQNAGQSAIQEMQKATLFFCVFTSGLLGVFAWLMTHINHSPWGLVGAAVVVITLTAQQAIRKPQSAVIVSSDGGSNLSRGAVNLSRGAV